MSQIGLSLVSVPWIFPVPLSKLQITQENNYAVITHLQEKCIQNTRPQNSRRLKVKSPRSNGLTTTPAMSSNLNTELQKRSEWNAKPRKTSALESNFQAGIVPSKVNQSSSLQTSKKSKTLQAIIPVLSEEECVFKINDATFYSCPVCKQTFPLFSEVQEHVRTHPSKRKEYQCDLCDKWFDRKKKLTRHKYTHSEERPYKCEICDKTFKYKGQVIEHKKTHSKEKRHFCDECDYATRNKCELKYHKNRMHKRVLDFICKLCGKNCPSPYELKSHEYTHGEKKFKCIHCGKGFHNRHNFQVHVEGHNPNRIKVQCEYCGNNFTHISGLKKHKLIVHLGQKKKSFQCEFCETVVTSRSSLEVHRRRHTGDKPFSCDVCEKAFNSKNYLITHKRIHTGEKPFTCNLCNKSFSQRGTLTIHKRSHTGLKPYECEKCSNTFVTKTLLKTHMKIH